MAYNRFSPDLKKELLDWADLKPERVERIPAWLGDAISYIWRTLETERGRRERAEAVTRITTREEARKAILSAGDWDHPIILNRRDHVFVNLEGFTLELRVILDSESRPYALEINNSMGSRAGRKLVVVPRASNVVYIEGAPD